MITLFLCENFYFVSHITLNYHDNFVTLLGISGSFNILRALEKMTGLGHAGLGRPDSSVTLLNVFTHSMSWLPMAAL